MKSKIVKFVKLKKEATIPEIKLGAAAAVDLYSCEECFLDSNGSCIVNTGIAWIPPVPKLGYKYVMVVQSRSGLAFKDGIEASNAGVIDQDYTGEIKVLLHRCSSEGYVLLPAGSRIAQGIIYEIPDLDSAEATIEELNQIRKTSERGNAGFGSTGV